MLLIGFSSITNGSKWRMSDGHGHVISPGGLRAVFLFVTFFVSFHIFLIIFNYFYLNSFVVLIFSLKILIFAKNTGRNKGLCKHESVP